MGRTANYDDQLRVLVEAGDHNVTQIAYMLGRDAATISVRMKKLGLQFPPVVPDDLVPSVSEVAQFYHVEKLKSECGGDLMVELLEEMQRSGTDG